ncbi:hypothetical protein O1R50_22325 [Glycomyces luteolus]|uniref:Uncharacterized protein n=1 Tax=Glycomyces luteolus TaxID=2670330 RepID=A0A9X3PF78_9ACTN|nr:hypothetical protein [Glycomyces luteolus]MDA1362378.1 hypothetical protein [Glycomyces luteolus]
MIAVISMQVIGFIWWRGAFAELAACALLLAALALVLVWLRLQRRLGRAGAVRRLHESELQSAEVAALRLLRRRAITVRSMLLLGVCAVFALVVGTLGDDPAWRALIDGDPGISPVAITSIDNVEKHNGRGGPSYNFDFTGSIPTSTSFHLVHDRSSSDVDPREADYWDGLVWAVYDPDDVSRGVVIADSYSEAVQAATFPLSPVVGFGGYVLILLSAAAFSKPPSKRIAAVSQDGRLAYYRGDVHRLRRKDMRFLAILGLIAAIIYLGCALRSAPTFEFTGEAFHASSGWVIVYGLAMQVVALIIANFLAGIAIGDARFPSR